MGRRAKSRQYFVGAAEWANLNQLNAVLSGQAAVPAVSPITSQPIDHPLVGKHIREDLPLFAYELTRPGGGAVVGVGFAAWLDKRQQDIMRDIFLNVAGFVRNTNIWWSVVRAADVEAAGGNKKVARKAVGQAVLAAANMAVKPPLPD